MSWWQSLIPMGIIGGLLMVAGNLPHIVHVKAYGKPKAVRTDNWDRLMQARDRRLLEELAQQEATE